jgi:hypothetical protein
MGINFLYTPPIQKLGVNYNLGSSWFLHYSLAPLWHYHLAKPLVGSSRFVQRFFEIFAMHVFPNQYYFFYPVDFVLEWRVRFRLSITIIELYSLFKITWDASYSWSLEILPLHDHLGCYQFTITWGASTFTWDSSRSRSLMKFVSESSYFFLCFGLW